jgi:small GTP-binding protein
MNGVVKIVVVGDGSIGKTCLLTVFVDKKFPAEYVPTVFNNMEYKMAIDGMVSIAIIYTENKILLTRNNIKNVI